MFVLLNFGLLPGYEVKKELNNLQSLKLDTGDFEQQLPDKSDLAHYIQCMTVHFTRCHFLFFFLSLPFSFSRFPQIQTEDDLKDKLQILTKDVLCSDFFLVFRLSIA